MRRIIFPRVLLAASLLFVGGCGDAPGRELSELLVRDSTYYEPETMELFAGPVFRRFADDLEQIQIRGVLRDGTWNGELTVYHPSGRVRYQGQMADGAQCGAWTENEDDTEPPDEYEALKRELESIVMYPSCP